MTEFVKGQWYQNETTKEYYQCIDTAHNVLLACRRAGQDTHIIRYGYADDYTTVSLNPDFSNAKVGDECFSPIHGIGYFTMMKHKYGETTVVYDNGVRDYAVCAKGTTTHPLRYNSFAQFKAYWAEQALLMATQRRKA